MLLLDQVKPVPPVKLTVVEPTHTCEGPATVGIGLTVMVDDVLEHPVAVLVKTNVVVPTDPPFTTPLGEIVAIEFPPEPPDQIPPVEGVKLIFAPTHT